MTQDEKEKFLSSLGKLMREDYEGEVTGCMKLKFAGTGPGGSDEDIELTFPDFRNISSIPAQARTGT